MSRSKPAEAPDPVISVPAALVEVPASKIYNHFGNEWEVQEFYGAVNEGSQSRSFFRYKRHDWVPLPTAEMSAFLGYMYGPKADLTTITTLAGYRVQKMNTGACFADFRQRTAADVRRMNKHGMGATAGEGIYGVVDLEQRAIGRVFTPAQLDRLDWLLPAIYPGYWNPHLRCLFFDMETTQLWKVFFCCNVLRYAYEGTAVADMAMAIQQYYPKLSRLQALYYAHFPRSSLDSAGFTDEEEEHLIGQFTYTLNWNHTAFDSGDGHFCVKKLLDSDAPIRKSMENLDLEKKPWLEDHGNWGLGVEGYASNTALLFAAMNFAQGWVKREPPCGMYPGDTEESWKANSRSIMEVYKSRHNIQLEATNAVPEDYDDGIPDYDDDEDDEDDYDNDE